MHLGGQLAHEAREFRLKHLFVGALRIRSFEVHVHAIERLRADRGDRVVDRRLGGVGCRGGRGDGADRVIGPGRLIMEGFDHENDAIARLMGLVDHADQVLAVPAAPSGVRPLDEISIGVDVESKVGDGAEQGVIPGSELAQLPIGSEAEHFPLQGPARCGGGGGSGRSRLDCGPGRAELQVVLQVARLVTGVRALYRVAPLRDGS